MKTYTILLVILGISAIIGGIVTGKIHAIMLGMFSLFFAAVLHQIDKRNKRDAEEYQRIKNLNRL